MTHPTGSKVRTILGPNKQLGLAAGEFMKVHTKNGKKTFGQKKRKIAVVVVKGQK